MRRVLAALFALALATGCSSSDGSDGSPPPGGSAASKGVNVSGYSDAAGHARSGTPAERTVYPGTEWATATPESMGFDAEALDEIAADAKAAASDCLTVVRHGKVVGSWRWKGTTPSDAIEAWSATKSFTSILTGIAHDEGKVDVDDKASAYIPSWKGTPSDAITVENLLSNDSGRYWDFQTDYYKMVGSPDRSKLAASLSQAAPPGKVWVYNNSAIQMLSEVLQQATGVEPGEYAQEKLLGPIGMTHSHMTTDQAGNTATFMGLQSTCEDMARFGLLMLRHGQWKGKQIVSKEWVADATSHPSQDLNAAYGYLFWLNRKGKLPIENRTATEPGEQEQRYRTGQKNPDAPDDMFWALGLGNQIIQMDPGTDTVVVRMGPGQKPAGAGKFTDDDTARVVTDALPDPTEEGS